MVKNLNCMRNRFVGVFATAIMVGLLAVSPAQASTYTWTGSGGNNNWQNNGNWSGASGYPGSISDQVIFPAVNTKHEEVDLSGARRTVVGMTFNLTSTASYLFRSSSSGGNLRNFGDLTSTDAQPVTFDSSMTYTQADLGNPVHVRWTLNADPQYMVFNGNVAGSSYSQITLHGGVTLNHANSYAGTFVIASDGLMKLGDVNALHAANVVLNADNGLNLNGLNAHLGALAGSGNLNIGSQTLTVGANNTDTTYSGVLSGAGGALTKTGTGYLTLSGANTFSGTTNINGGKIVADNADALQNSTVSINVNNGLNVNTNAIDANLGGLTGSGNLNIGSQTLTVGANNADTTYSGILSGTGGALTKTGTGTLTLSGANTYTSKTTIEGGSVSISADNNLGNGGALVLDHGTLITNGSFSLNRNVRQSNLHGNASAIQVNSAGDILTLNGSLSGTTNLKLNKTGDGALRLNQAGSYAGEVQINAGSIIIGTPNALQDAIAHVNVDGGLDLTTAGSDATLAGLTGSGNVDNGGHNLTINGTLNEIYAGILSGSGGLTKIGFGNLTLTAANTFSGDTHIGSGSGSLLNGSVVLGNADALQNSTVHINDNGGLNINGLNANLGGLAGSGNLNIGTQTLTVGTNNAATTYAGVLSGDSTAVLTKTGSGDLTFTGGDSTTPSDFGRLKINSGRLILDNAVAQLTGGSSYVGGGTVADLILTGSAASLTGGRLDAGEFSSGPGNIVVENNATGSFSSLRIGVAGAGHLTVQSGGRLDSTSVSFGSSNALVGTGLVTGTSSLLTANTLTFGAQSTSPNMLTIQDGGDVQVAGTTRFNNPTNLLTVNGGTFATDTLVNASAGTPVISISNPSGGTALTIGTGNGSSTWDGLIQDATGEPGSLTKTGTGTLTLSSANTFSGATNIDAGKIVLANANALQNSTVSINVNDGLDVTTNAINANLGGLAGSGNLDIGSQHIKVGANNADTTYAGIITGSSTSRLDKKGTGTLTLTGGVTGSASQLQRLYVGAGDLAINSGAHLQVNDTFGLDYGHTIISDTGTTVTAQELYVTGQSGTNGTLSVENNATLNVTDSLVVGYYSPGNATIHSGAQVQANYLDVGLSAGSDGSNLLATGNGTFLNAKFQLSLGSRSSADDASMHIENGADVQTASVKFWTAGSTLTVNGGTFSTDTLVNSSGGTPVISISDPSGGTALTVGTGNSSSTWDGLIQDAGSTPGSILKTGTGKLTLSGANTYSGGTTLDGGTLSLQNSAAAGTGTITIAVDPTLDYADGIDVANPINLTADATLRVASGAATQSGKISETGGSFGITKTGTGTLIVTGTNSYTDTTITGGTIQVGDGGVSGTLGSGNIVNNGVLTFNRSNNPTVASDISGRGEVHQIGTGELRLSGSNSYTGGTTISSGRISIFYDSNLGDPSGDLTFDGGALTGLYPTLNIQRDATINAGGGRLDVGRGQHMTYNGVISGSGALKKFGNGVLKLASANTYAGGTTITRGTLLAENTTGSATGTGPVTVTANGTLGGNGFIAGAVTVNTGGIVAPGKSPGLLTINNDFTMNSGSSLAIQIAGLTPGSQYDVLDVTDNADISGSTLDVSLLNAFTLASNQQFDILNVGGTLTGQFANLGQDALVGNFGGTNLYITYIAGSGNDVALYTTNTPEPTSLALLIAAGPILLRRRRA